MPVPCTNADTSDVRQIAPIVCRTTPWLAESWLLSLHHHHHHPHPPHFLVMFMHHQTVLLVLTTYPHLPQLQQHQHHRPSSNVNCRFLQLQPSNFLCPWQGPFPFLSLFPICSLKDCHHMPHHLTCSLWWSPRLFLLLCPATSTATATATATPAPTQPAHQMPMTSTTLATQAMIAN